MMAFLKKEWFSLICILAFWLFMWQAGLQADAGNVAMVVLTCFCAFVSIGAVVAVILSEQIDKLIEIVKSKPVHINIKAATFNEVAR